MTKKPKVRIHVPDDLAIDHIVTLPQDQSNYLINVMRLSEGDVIEAFNGRDDSVVCMIDAAHRKRCRVKVAKIYQPFRPLSDLWLFFAPIKKQRTDFIVEKAAELGVAKIFPVMTEFTNSERFNRKRLQAHAIEAAEQCGGTAIPELCEPARLSNALASFPKNRHLFFADESSAGTGIEKLPNGPAAILIGPEGGFSDSERHFVRGMGNCYLLPLGSRILRADTAIVAAITRWHVETGQW